jgi:hypothetical protein
MKINVNKRDYWRNLDETDMSTDMRTDMSIDMRIGMRMV